MQYETHFGVYALIIHPLDGRVLLIKKALGCYTGLYNLPGGTMEAHELLEQSLCREVLEETDCTVLRTEQMGTFSILYPHRREEKMIVLRHIGCIYLTTVSGTPRETSNGTDDSDGCIWLPPHEITEKNSAPFVVQALEAYTRRSST